MFHWRLIVFVILLLQSLHHHCAYIHTYIYIYIYIYTFGFGMYREKLLSFLLLLGLLVCVAASPAHGRRRKASSLEHIEWDERMGRPIDEDDPVIKSMPNPEVPELYLPLKCSACGAIVEHAIHLLKPVIEDHLERKKRAVEGGNKTIEDFHPKEFEIVDALEQLCQDVSLLYGLEMNDARVASVFFTKSKMIRRVLGTWMPSFLISTCEELLDEQEEELVSAIFTAAEENAKQHPTIRVRQMICTKWQRSSGGCDKNGMPIDPRVEDSPDL
ncbi:hypothetical protein MOQ_000369 [Trypanosoma cruzi marinkellei]|uniref:DUF3456 domain-containing protein n=1 Tax=Trypanosoma cruzi marinkellei TaxID=85056 RepID=K2MVX5_TRYCR|nr:hypothetical protein MOQ_000369 [Trypanosoma cruzi marinkellei]